MGIHGVQSRFVKSRRKIPCGQTAEYTPMRRRDQGDSRELQVKHQPNVGIGSSGKSIFAQQGSCQSRETPMLPFLCFGEDVQCAIQAADIGSFYINSRLMTSNPILALCLAELPILALPEEEVDHGAQGLADDHKRKPKYTVTRELPEFLIFGNQFCTPY
jgi:hypothetical protein